MADLIRYTVEEKVATLVIDHPPVNAFNNQALTELGAAVDALLADANVKVIVITGAGQMAFVAGADIGEIGEIVKNKSESAAKAMIELGQKVFNKIEGSNKPVIAAINGFCLGGGLELAMSCHIRIAGDRSRFGQPEIGLGIMPGWGGTQRLPRIVGIAHALDILFAADPIDAAHAYRIGLINRLTPKGGALAAAKTLIEVYAQRAPLSLALVKRAVHRGMQMDLASGIELETFIVTTIYGTEDKQEGISAFLEKRAARFKGK